MPQKTTEMQRHRVRTEKSRGASNDDPPTHTNNGEKGAVSSRVRLISGSVDFVNYYFLPNLCNLGNLWINTVSFYSPFRLIRTYGGSDALDYLCSWCSFSVGIVWTSTAPRTDCAG